MAASEFGGELSPIIHFSASRFIQYLFGSGLTVSTTSFQKFAQAGQSSLTIILDNLGGSQNLLTIFKY